MSLISHSVNVYYFCILNRSEAGYLEPVKVIRYNTVIMMFIVQQFNVIYCAVKEKCGCGIISPLKKVTRLKYYPFVATCGGVVY